jgi:hypothetical protein
MSDFGEGRTVKAGKQHQCIWCYEHVMVNEYHHHYKGMWEGDWQDWRMHLDCLKACREEQDGESEVHDEGHERGRTCEETEGKRFEFIRELAQIVEADRKNGKSDYEIAQAVLGEVEDWQSAEKIRVKKAREEAMKKPAQEVAS